MAPEVSPKKQIKRNYLEFDQSDPLLTFANIKPNDPMLSYVKSDIKLEFD